MDQVHQRFAETMLPHDPSTYADVETLLSGSSTMAERALRPALSATNRRGSRHEETPLTLINEAVF